MSCSAVAISSSSNLCSGLVSALPARAPVVVGTFGVTAFGVTTFGGATTLGGVTTFGVTTFGIAIFGAATFSVATFAARALSATPFHIDDGALKVPGLSFETSHP